MTRRALPLLFALLLAGCGTQTPLPSVSTSASPSESRPAPSVSVAPLDLAAVPLWGFDLGEEPAWPWVPGIGLADGTITARIEVAGLWTEPAEVELVRGPAGGLVLYGRMATGAIDLHLVDAVTGADRVVGRIPATAEDAEIAPDGSAIYWIDAAAAGGVWRLDPASGERSLVLARVQVATAHSGTVLAAAARAHAELALSADGTRLAALWCGVERCVLQVIRFGDDAIQAMPLTETWHQLFGFAGDEVALLGACADVATQVLRERDCDAPDAAARAAEVRLNFRFGVELPAGWTLDIVPLPDAEPMSFSLQAVAVPADGGDPIPLEALGVLHGQ